MLLPSTEAAIFPGCNTRAWAISRLAVADAERSVDYADPVAMPFSAWHSAPPWPRPPPAKASGQLLVAVLPGRGHAGRASAEYPLLYSLQGFLVNGELLLAEAERAAWGGPDGRGMGQRNGRRKAQVAQRATQTLAWAEINQASLLPSPSTS